MVQIAAFPLLVPPSWRATSIDDRSSGGPCPNSAARTSYTSAGVSYPIERPVLYDSFAAARGDRVHEATDITCARGTPVVAPVDGQVVESWRYEGETRPGAGWSERGGWYVYLRDAEGNAHYFAHMDARPLVRSGERVVAGQQLGVCGDTGNADGGCPHLHYGIRTRAGVAINPEPLLRPLYEADAWVGEPIRVGGAALVRSVTQTPWLVGLVGLAAGAGVAWWWRKRR